MNAKSIQNLLLFIVLFFLSGSPSILAQEVYPEEDESTGKWGMKNDNDELVVDYIYDWIADPNYYGVARVSKDDKYAYINNKGELLTGWLEEAEEYIEEEGLVKKDGQFNIINAGGKLLYKDWYEYIYYYLDGSPNIVYHQGNWHFMKSNGKLDKQKWEETYGWDDYMIMLKFEGEWLCWDVMEGEQTDKGFKDVYYYSDGLSLQERYGKWGYIDEQGNLRIPFQFENAKNFYEGYAAVTDTNAGYGYINKQGKLVIDYSFFSAEPFKNGLAKVGKFTDELTLQSPSTKQYTYINTQGESISGKWYEYISDFSEGMALVLEKQANTSWFERKCGYIDDQGNQVIPVQFDAAHDFSGGLAAVAEFQGKDSLGDPVFKMGFIDKSGTVVIDHQFDYGNRPGYSPYPEAYQFSEGLASVGKQTVLKFSSIHTPEFSNPNIREIGKPEFIFGYINEKGEVQIDYEFDQAGLFINGIARVSKNGKEYCIDKTGGIIPCPAPKE